MSRFNVFKLAGLTAIAGALAACGQTLDVASTGLYGLQNADGARAPGPKGGLRGGPMGLFAGLDLTEDQQGQIRAIAEKYRPEAPTEQPAARTAVRDALLAETVDADALRAALQAGPQAPRPIAPAEMLVEVYAVLTEAQRAAIVERLQSQPERSAPDGDKAAEHEARRAEHLAALDLTDAQKAALDALESALKAATPADGHAANKAAMIAFWQTGDASALTASQPTPPAFPVEELVQAAQALDLTQRQALFGRQMSFGPGGRGDAGPRGHHAFGPGGPGAR